MKKEDLCEVFGDINQDYVEKARADRKVKRTGWIRWGAIAACLCLIAVTAITVPTLLHPQESTPIGSDEQPPAPKVVTAPGFLTLTAYVTSPEEEVTAELPSHKEIIMQEGIEVPLYYNWTPAMSSRPGIPLNLSDPECPDTMFEVSVDGGELLLWEEKKITHIESPYKAENDTTIYWTSLSQTGEGNTELYMESKAYINIVSWEGDNIVGYAVVEIYTDHLDHKTEQAYMYYAKLLKSVSFPKVNGDDQRIAADYVETEMQKIRNENTDMGQEV